MKIEELIFNSVNFAALEMTFQIGISCEVSKWLIKWYFKMTFEWQGCGQLVSYVQG